jgi:hypothetical protein
VIGVILAAYPHLNWGYATVSLWAAELAPVGATEGMAAAREMYRNGTTTSRPSRTSPRTAKLGERRADEHRPNFKRLAQVSAERITPPEEAKATSPSCAPSC